MEKFFSSGKETFVFYGLIALSVLLTRVPFFGKLFRSVNTMVHESGHALVALLTGGGVVEINLQYDTSGAAKTQSRYWLGKVLVSLAGYPASSIVAFGAFYLVKNACYPWILYFFVSLCLLNLALWVRNLYGFVWLLIMLGAIGFAFYYKNEIMIYILTVVLSTIVLIESVVSTFVLFVIAVKEPAKAGDAANLQAFTYVPAVIWSLLFVGIALYMAYKTILLFYVPAW